MSTITQAPALHMEITGENLNDLLRFHFVNEGWTKLLKRVDEKWIDGTPQNATHIQITFTPDTYAAFGKAFGLKRKRGE